MEQRKSLSSKEYNSVTGKAITQESMEVLEMIITSSKKSKKVRNKNLAAGSTRGDT